MSAHNTLKRVYDHVWLDSDDGYSGVGTAVRVLYFVTSGCVICVNSGCYYYGCSI